MEENTDHLERLPDSLVLFILGLVGDVKALVCCSATCRRFGSLVPLVDSVHVRADIVVYVYPSSPSRPILKPSFSQPSSSSSVSRPSLAQVLNKFRELRRLRIQLHTRELPVDGGTLLKWRATFGSTIDSCVILSSPRLKEVGLVNSLMISSSRHCLIRQIVSDHEKLESLEMSDADWHGTLTMDVAQLRELRSRPPAGTSQGMLVPALSAKLWHAWRLEIPGGVVLKDVILVAMKRTWEVDGGDEGEGEDWVSDAFEEPYRTATRMLLKTETFFFKMDSF